MASNTPQTPSISIKETDNSGNKFAFIAMTILFFFWGFITVLNDILIPHLKAAFDLNYTQAMLVQFCFFGAYFIVSPFAGRLIDNIGYQNGIVVGLITTALGCILFYPSADLEIYALFLFAFFVLAGGITVLQVAANPYVAALGPENTAASRLNLAQALNSLGTTVGPIFGAILILDATINNASAVQIPYLIIAGLLIIAAIAFKFITLPKLQHVQSDTDEAETSTKSIWEYKSLVLGTGAIFLYVGGEVSIGSFLVNYFAESSIMNMSEADAGEMVAYYWGAAMIGRFIGAAMMKFIKDTRYLALNVVAAILMIIISMNTSGEIAMWSILSVGFFNSIMFPTIFTIAIKGLGPLTSKGSSILCQAIVGGALVPVIQGVAADFWGIQLSFTVPLLCYLYIVWYAVRGTISTAQP